MRCGWLLVAMVGMWGPLAWDVQARDLADPRIFRALVPMPAGEAKRLVQRLGRAGLAEEWHASLDTYLRNEQVGDSRPIELPARSGRLCLAMALRQDVEAVLALAPVQDTETRRAVGEFLLTHEAAHCVASMALTDPFAQSDDSTLEDPELNGLPLLREESLADQMAHHHMHSLGRAGYHASVAWQRYRLFGLLRGDLDHWTTPLVQHGLDSVSEGDYRAFAQAWLGLIRALNHHEDGSDAQTRAWHAATDRIPASLRSGLPSLEVIRALALQRWGHAVDWRCASGIQRGSARASKPGCTIR
jgi:hypothetical protein